MYIGIDLGGTNIAIGIVDEKGNIIHRNSIPTGAQRPQDEILTDMANLATNLISSSGLKTSDIEYIGIGSPGTVDSKNGILKYTNNINFFNAPMAAIIGNLTGLPVFIENDANCAALGEFIFEENKDIACFIAITLGTGVGSGVIINGKIFSGGNSAAPEIGHMVIEAGGILCTCGREGCWESYGSVTGLTRMTRNALLCNKDTIMHEMTPDIDDISGKTAFNAAKKGDKIALQVVEKYIDYVAIGLANVINIFEPEVLVIGGGLSKEGEYLLAPVRDKVAKWVYCKEVYNTQIKQAKLGNDAGIIGAAYLGR